MIAVSDIMMAYDNKKEEVECLQLFMLGVFLLW